MSSARERPVSEGSAPKEPANAEPGPADPSFSEGDPIEGGAEAEFRSEVRDALAKLTKQLERDHQRAGHREAVIDRLHQENQELRRGELQAMLEPIRTALYRLHDLARQGSDRWSAPEPPEPKDAADLLAAVADEVADALARTGVERFSVDLGAPYDATRHRPVAVEAVTDPALAGTVVAVRTHGFEHAGKVVRKAEVSVGKIQEPPEVQERPAGKHAAPAGRQDVPVHEQDVRVGKVEVPAGRHENAGKGDKAGKGAKGDEPAPEGGGNDPVAVEPLRNTENERDDEHQGAAPRPGSD
ncbi:nucleotide exchange factor GrpE [Actinomadura barringtoniae]|uniref:Nucleotide exchange factor GrpE n=1 Tax=Actinomadura barringtoniae TaxID=1427535 RepID=A0A939PJT4_9ACTN|nr:nucleotide exchange factor GrpE [Actinomadura barringtoniae]MBO2453665.1 nucleotide exchange factor GrpE [Actinomadura barringtoniae]